MKFILLSLLLSTICFAYGPKDINLNDFEYRRYVTPQLTSISQDFITLIMLINPELNDLKPIFSKFRSLHTQLLIADTKCSAKSIERCEKSLNEAKKLTNQIISHLKTPPSLIDKENFTTEDIMISNDHFHKLKNEIYAFYLDLDNFIFLKDSQIQNVKSYKGYSYFPTQSKKLFASFFNYIFVSSDNRFRDEFISFWNEFYTTTIFHILKGGGQKIFLKKLNELNVRLNILNIVLTKRNHKISKPTATLLKVIHRRWNNVLKVTIRK